MLPASLLTFNYTANSGKLYTATRVVQYRALVVTCLYKQIVQKKKKKKKKKGQTGVSSLFIT